jgi:hypothetical protein
MHYNTYHINLHPATTIYCISAPRYASVVDNEGFEPLIAAEKEPVCSFDCKLAYQYK